MDEKRLQFNARIGSFERLNEQFMKVKINVCHKGKNANKTDFKESAMKDLERTILGVPIVGEFDEDKKQFKGHGGKLVVEEDRVEWVRTTQPYGFVPFDQIPFYETILEPDGMTKNDYLTVYAILWTELYPELYEAFEKKMNQSMEIRVGASQWDEDGEYCEIHHATMSALCLLQAVKPCFKSSVVTNQFSEVGFDGQYQALVQRYQQYALGEGGDGMEENQVVPTETTEVEETVEPVTNEDVENVADETSTEETTTESFEENPTDDVETSVTEEVAVEETSVEEPSSEEVAPEEYNETSEKTEEEPKEEPVDENPTDLTEPVEEEPQEELPNYEQQYQELLVAYEEKVLAFETLTAQFNELNETCQSLKAFQDEVLAERREKAETELFARFEELSGFEGFEELKKQSAQFELADLEKELFVLAGRKMFALKQKQPTQTTTVSLETQPLRSKAPTVFGLLDEFITK